MIFGSDREPVALFTAKPSTHIHDTCFPGMRLRTTASGIATGFMAASLRAGYAPWASGTNPLHRPRPGRMVCGMADWIDRVSIWTHHCLGRDAFASGPEILRRLLQLRQIASILEKGYAGFSPGSASRCDQFTRHPWWTSSAPHPRLSCRYTHYQYFACAQSLATLTYLLVGVNQFA